MDDVCVRESEFGCFFVCIVFLTVMQGCLCGFLCQAMAVLSGMRCLLQLGLGENRIRLTERGVCVCGRMFLCILHVHHMCVFSRILGE